MSYYLGSTQLLRVAFYWLWEQSNEHILSQTHKEEICFCVD